MGFWGTYERVYAQTFELGVQTLVLLSINDLGNVSP